MAVIRFDPEVPVMDRFAKGFPQHEHGAPATYGPFSEACETPFGFDAHFCAYSLPSVPRRLAGSGALAHRPKMVLFVADVDGPDHKCPPEWWTAEKVKLAALFKARGRGYAYTTRGGYRIVYGLREELELAQPADAARWSASYEDWIAGIRRDFDIICDDSCSDWTRLYRLPRVVRDGVETEPAEELGRADRMLDWSEPYCAADDPRTQRAAPTAIEVAEAAPVDEDKLAEAALALAAVWPTRGRHHASLALTGALARAGWSDEAIAEFAYAVSEFAEPGNGMHEKRLAQARSSAEKVARGEDVAGWPSLVEHLCTGRDGTKDESRRAAVEAAVLSSRRSMGMGPPIDLFGDARLYSAAIRSELAKRRADGDAMASAAPEDDGFMALLDEAAEVLGPVFEAAQVDQKKKLARDIKQARRMFMSGRALMAADIQAPKYLVESLLVEGGVSALSGEPKSGKSWDATHIALCLASGSKVYGHFDVPEKVGVAYFYAEDPASSVKIRMGAIAAGLGIPKDGDWLDRWYPQPRGRQIDARSLFDMCLVVASVWAAGDEFGSPIRLLVLDPLSDVHSGEEDKRDSMATIMHIFRGVAVAMSTRAKCEVGIMFVHHSSKTSAESKGRKRGGQKMRGSSAIHGAVDNGMYLDNLRGDRKSEYLDRMESEVKSAKSAGRFDRLIAIEDDTFGHATCAKFTWSEEAVESAEGGPTDLADERAYQIVQKLALHGAPLTSDELKKKIGGKGTIHVRALDIAVEEGWIKQRYTGGRSCGYEITEVGRQLIQGGGSTGDGPAGGDAPAPPRGPVGGFLASVIGTN